ncbi:MAG: type I methionyl aminopeptidase [Clostridiales bacterium]|nr:type I methionyl aminopeptidase [Clostridiales bacterium]
MINIKTEKDLETMRIACQITRDTLDYLKSKVRVGITTKELDKLAYDYIISRGAKPSFLGYGGFPATICTSINSVVVHGIPDDTVLCDGDIISIDCGAYYNGFHGDAARTYTVGKVSPKVKRLIKITEQSFFEGIKGLKSGAFVGDISNRVQTFVEKNGYSVVRELVGHGIGREMHEDPMVPNFGKAGSGVKLNAGATIAIEPMVNMGDRKVMFLSDGWTCKTKDDMPSAHYENTVLITENGVEILTL